MLLEQVLRLDKKNGTEKFTETLYQLKLARIRRKEPGWRPQESLKQTSKLQDHVERDGMVRSTFRVSESVEMLEFEKGILKS